MHFFSPSMQFSKWKDHWPIGKWNKHMYFIFETADCLYIKLKFVHYTWNPDQAQSLGLADIICTTNGKRNSSRLLPQKWLLNRIWIKQIIYYYHFAISRNIPNQTALRLNTGSIKHASIAILGEKRSLSVSIL